MDFIDPFGGHLVYRELPYEEGPGQADARPAVPSEFSQYVGLPAVFRLIAAASPIRGWPQGLQVGSVSVYQTNRPIPTKRAFITQLPGRAFTLDKTIYHFDASAGRFVTLAVLPVVIPDHHLAAALDEWHEECLAALGVLTSLLDERICQEQVAEDLIICSSSGNPVALVDYVPHVPNLDPTAKVTKAALECLQQLASLSTEGSAPYLRAARWYIKGVHEGPTADGVLFLCTALEALVHPQGRKKPAFNRSLIEEAIRKAGGNPECFRVDVGRIAGLRARVVHHGEETPEQLTAAFYVLEEIVRLLIRYELPLRSGEAWPVDYRAALERSGAYERTGRQRLKIMVTHADWADIPPVDRR
jgi:hypothetical protein